MSTLTKEYKQFLNENFKGLTIRKPLFYNWDKGLRFDLQVGETGTEEYFLEVVNRANTLFQAAFNPEDVVYFVLYDYKSKRSRIRFSNYGFKQIKDLRRNEISYSKLRQLYYPDDRLDIWNTAVLKLTTDRINFKNILTAIGHTDFPSRQPGIGQEIYFININKKLIFNMYDHRGLDIMAADIETLRPIYKKFNDWILDYDREQIDRIMDKDGIYTV